MGWHERNHERPNYRRIDWYWQQHHRRFVVYVKREGLPCQDCGAEGGYKEIIIDGQGPWYDCGWCQGTGRTSRWLRGMYLRMKREEKRGRHAA